MANTRTSYQGNITDSMRYPVSEIKTIICFFSLEVVQQIELTPSLDRQTLFNFFCQ